MPATKKETRTERQKTVLLAGGLLLLIGAVQVWIVSAGFWIHWPRYSDDFSRLAAGFLHGELSLLVRPPPQMLSLADPYDPKQNAPWRWHDASLYNGRYYIYWGSVPSLLTAAVCWPLQIDTPDFGDQYLAEIFTFGTVVLATILILHARATLFPELPIGAAVIPILSIGLGAPLLYNLGRAAMYETAIIAGQFFLLGGILAAWLGLVSPRPRPWLFTLAGVSWALAIASRLSLPPAVGAVVLLTLRQLKREGKPWVRAIPRLIVPLLIAALALALYNFARFHSVFEFGLHYQIGTANQHAMAASDFSSPRFMLPNLVIYLINIPYRLKAFPYVWATGDRSWITRLFRLPLDFRPDPVVGLIWCQPFLVFGFVALASLWRNKSLPAEPAANTSPFAQSWLTLSLASASLLAFMPTLTMRGDTMRYIVDLVPGFTILSALGYWQAIRWAKSRPRLSRELTAISRLMIITECFMGLMLSITGLTGQFAANNPALFDRMRGFFPKLWF